MSLTDLIRNAALGIALTLGCAPSENKFDHAFDTAREQLEQQRIEVRGGLWNDENAFSRLVDYMREDLGDGESRRYGRNSCEQVSLSSYDPAVFYCGPGAVQGNCDRLYSGDCFNQVCYDHDQCYDDLLDEENQLCLWSNQTRGCDEQFFRGYGRCAENDECGFYCQLIRVIAANLTVIEQGYDAVGPGCLWDGNYEPPTIRDDQEENKVPNDDTNLIDLCVEWHQRIYLDCLHPPKPNLYEQLMKRDCNADNIESIMRNRSRLECVYEKDCNSFRDCLDKNPTPK